MTSTDQLIQIVRHIDTHLTEDIDVVSIAALMGMSDYQFCKIFSSLIGETPGSYLRARRLSEASRRLVSTRDQIIYLAFDFGFESPEAFTRSFTNRFGVSPTEYRKRGLRISTLERKAITADEIIHRIDNHVTFTPIITSFPGEWIIGLQSCSTVKNNTMPNLWQQFIARQNELRSTKNPPLHYGVCLPWDDQITINSFTEDTEYPVFVGQAVTSTQDIPPEMTNYHIPPGNYAVFTHRGSLASLYLTYQYIYGIWALDRKTHLSGKGDFERYDHRFNLSDPDLSEIDIWISIV